MGLDMYLRAERFLWSMPGTDEADAAQSIAAMFPELAGIDGAKVQTVSAEVGYWRKANAIHDWFVKNVQGGKDNCESFDVSLEQLNTLRTACLEVLIDNTLAAKLLPTSSGFFFGDTSYGESYLMDVARTVDIIDSIKSRLFNKVLDDGTVYSRWDIKYQSSW